MSTDPTPETADDTATEDTAATENGAADTLPRDGEGSLIDPPVIPRYEREMHEAQMSGDPDRIADVQEEYDAARERLAARRAEREATE